MRNYITALCLFILSMSVQAADAQQQIRTTINDFLVGASNNNASVHDAFWAKELVYTSSDGTRFNKATLMADVRQEGPVTDSSKVTRYSAEKLHIWLHQDIAVVTFVLVATTPDGHQKRFLNSGTLIHRDGRWQAVNWQATHKKP